MHIDPGDRLAPPPKKRSGWRFLGPVLAISSIAGTAYMFAGGVPEKLLPLTEFHDVYDRLKVAPLSFTFENIPAVRLALAKLHQEPCSKTAIHDLSEALVNVQEQRLAATLLEGYAASCSNGLGDLRRAADLFLQIGDDQKALSLTGALVRQHPDSSDFWYLNGKAQVALHHYEDALESYANSLRLQRNRASLGEWVFTEMAEIYAALNRYCEAIDPIEEWVAIAPGSRADARADAIIENYRRRGQCQPNASGGEVFRSTGGIIRIHAEINGVPGIFIVDTGASYVFVGEDFAGKAGLALRSAQVALAQTANGIVDVRFTTAQSVKAGHAEAQHVAVVVGQQAFGDGTDGLLGMSFLSRFEITIKPGTIQISSRTNAPTEKAR